MSDFAPVIELSSLDGTTGFKVNGTAAGDTSGYSVTTAGDVNGDGYIDFIIGAAQASGNGLQSGSTYVVFGGPAGFPASFNLSSLDGSNGFRFDGGTFIELSGCSVASAGDVNGDGYDDIIIGARVASPNGNSSGASYVVFGKASGFAASLNPSTFDGTNGFKISGAAAGDALGRSVASAGDINGDGFADIIVGAPSAGPHGNSSGAGYVIFGKAAGFATNFDLSSLNGANGFRIAGAATGDYAGWSVASAGDVNHDGFDDIIVGARGANANGGDAGAAYVVFGTASAFAANLDLSGLDGTNGFKISGASAYDSAGISVSSAGDVNGDGYDDVIVGAWRVDSRGDNAGASYVVFGKASGFAANLNLSGLDGTNGFKINGGAAGDYSGRSVAGAGDVNGDGYDDVIVGSAYASPNGSQSGASYVIFGKASGFAAVLNVTNLDGNNGFKLNGQVANDRAGFSVGSAGDLNHDGFDDVMVGAFLADPNGSASGATYIVYGRGSLIVNWTGGAGDETKVGGVLADTLSGGGGKDNLSGLGGDDALNGDAGNDTIAGGDGVDTLHGGADNDIVGGDAGDDFVYGDDGNDKVSGGAGADHLFGGTGADQLDGGDGVDVLDGGDGNDTLTGGAGADAMSGGLGNDVYYVDDAGDTTVEALNEGVDIVRASLSWVLGSNVEQLELQGSGNLNGTGNELANRLVGNGGANTLSGLGGVDTIDGGGGDDRIIGGTGNDMMTGGSGADTFAVLQESVYSSKAPAGRALEIDFVYDLNKAEGDRLDLSAIDANANLAGDQAFTLVGAFTKTAGQMTLAYTASTNLTVLSLDTDGDGKADYQMKITGDVHLDSGGWLL